MSEQERELLVLCVRLVATMVAQGEGPIRIPEAHGYTTEFRERDRLARDLNELAALVEEARGFGPQ